MTKKNRRVLIAGGAAVIAVGGLALVGARRRKTSHAPGRYSMFDEGFEQIQYDESIGAGTVRPRPIELD